MQATTFNRIANTFSIIDIVRTGPAEDMAHNKPSDALMLQQTLPPKRVLEQKWMNGMQNIMNI